MSDSEQHGSPADEGLVHALELDGRGGGRELGWEDLTRGDRPRWIHLDRSHSRADEWIANEAGIDPIVVEALLADETRPRATFLHGGLLVNLRGVNLNPGANPEDMISLRAWLEKDRLITVRLRPVMAVQEVHSSLLAGTGPARPASILIAVMRRLVDRAGTIIEELDDLVGSAEEKLLTSAPAEMRMELSDVRRVAIMLRRYLAPQRDTLSRMPAEHAALFEQSEILLLREASDGMLRLVEDLDAARDRAAVLHEELSARLAESMNRNMYLLSVVASIFMPLGLITGLFGINVAGMPWIENELGFIYISASLLLIGLIQYVVLKKLKVI
jgi:zinc transporter